MKENQIVTNEELQQSLSKKIRSMDDGTSDNANAKIYFSGARALLGSVKIDLDASKKLGVPMFQRTKQFLGVDG